ncbi:MAG: APC family permease, partial [bacterium]
MASGTGLVIANMVGAGVFLSFGFMAQELGPAEILLSWVAGAIVALIGVYAYSALAVRIARSGGEYRYLSETLHPSMGYLAGWASLLIGFSAAIAIDAHAVGAFLNTILPGANPDPRHIGLLLIIVLTVTHAYRLNTSRTTQNILVAIKLSLIIGFIAAGLSLGARTWPVWSPPGTGNQSLYQALLNNQYWIAFAFSGWNAAIYAAEEFKDPARDVTRAMLWGCSFVALLYLVLNWVFAANLSPDVAAAVFEHEETQITLAHLVSEKLLGPVGATLTSAAMIIVFTSAMSAMMLIGSRVYDEMAKDGYLPAFLRSRPGYPPQSALVLQGVIAAVFLYSHTLLQAVQSVAAILMLSSGLTAFSVIRLQGAGMLARMAGATYAACMIVLLWAGLSVSWKLFATVCTVIAVALLAYVLSERQRNAIYS